MWTVTVFAFCFLYKKKILIQMQIVFESQWNQSSFPNMYTKVVFSEPPKRNNISVKHRRGGLNGRRIQRDA